MNNWYFSTDLSVAQVSLVAQHNEREVRWVLWLSLHQELLPPVLQGHEAGFRRDVKHQHAALGPSVQRGPQRLEPLCTCCVPDLTHREAHKSALWERERVAPGWTGGRATHLQRDRLSVYADRFREEIRPYCGPVHVGEAVIHIPVHAGGLSHPK